MPILLLVGIANAKRIALKATPYRSQEHPDHVNFTFVVRVLLFVLFVFSARSCGRAFIDKADEQPLDQPFNSEIWKKNDNMGMVRHTMLKSLKEKHSFLLGKSQTQVIDVLGNPDTISSYNPNTDSTLHWRSKHPTMYMGGDENITVCFKEAKSYRILFNYWPSQK